ncbi:MAG: hypothetical protein HC927_10190 [Deltaproteobacteria bacterium]|nr:hypothetical protein [Deltaproteobacteria bacterium]
MLARLALFAALLGQAPSEPKTDECRKGQIGFELSLLGGADYRATTERWYGSGQLHLGAPFAGCRWGVLVWPSLGMGFDASHPRRSTRAYGLATLGVVAADYWYLVGYHAGGMVGGEQSRVLGGFHHALELRGPLVFWGIEVQHEVLFGADSRHDVRVLFVLDPWPLLWFFGLP